MENKMTNIEKQIIEIIATDRIDKPISSMSGKLKRMKPKLAKVVPIAPGKSFDGERVYARVETDDSVMKARGMREGINKFEKEHPRWAKVLNGYIAEERANSETHVYFGMYEGKRLTQADYVGVMTDLGLSEGSAMALYQPLMEVSRKLSRARDEGERSVLIG